MECPKCGSKAMKNGRHKEYQRYRCMNADCRYRFDSGLYDDSKINSYVSHFGVKVKDNGLKLARETYAIIDKKVHNPVPYFMREYYSEHEEERMQYYDDIECTVYSDLWCQKHREDCLLNFDLNMRFFSSLDSEIFNKKLNAFIKKHRKLREIVDLNECADMIGIYVMVLDEYKQVYIGQSSSSIKTRIMRHWSKNKEFDKLIFGRVENSILSIDSFKALDTTRIFVYPCSYSLLDSEESKLVKSMDAKYLLNRTAGGIQGNDSFAILEVMANRKTREL